MTQRLRNKLVAILLTITYLLGIANPAIATQITWSHTFQDLEVLTAAQLEQLKTDITAVVNAGGGPVGLTNTQTVSGVKTFSGANTHSGVNTFSAANTFSSTVTISGNLAVTGYLAGVNTRGQFRNLAVTRGGVTAVTATADALVVADSSATTYLLSSVNVTGTITTAGANGLDTGAEGSSRWYFLYVIYNDATTTKAALLSESATSPTLPSGYDHYALVSAVYNDGSSNFINFYQTGRDYTYAAWRSAATGGAVSLWTAIDTSAFVPSALSSYPWGTLNRIDNSIAITNDNTVSTTEAPAAGVPNRVWHATGSTNDARTWQLPILTANTLYWGSSGGSSQVVYIAGFTINKIT